MTAAAHPIATRTRPSTLSSQFNPKVWAIGVSVLCLAPLVSMAMGVDFSTEIVHLTVADAALMDQATLSESVHAAARGNYTHTLLEWTATCYALFLFGLAFM